MTSSGGDTSRELPAIRRCGDTALLLDVADNQTVHRWAATVRADGPPGILDVVPGLHTLLVVVDPDRLRLPDLEHALHRLRPAPADASAAEEVVLDVHYTGADLEQVCAMTSMTRQQVIAAHTGSVWQVAFCGFAPGFAYLVGGDPRLQVPRRGESRVRVPPGSVALAGRFTSIYPRASPGGWQLIGQTDAVLWDLDRDPPTALGPGARVRFRDVTDD